MPRDERLFGDVVEPSIRMGDRQGRSVAATIVLEALLVAVFITIPLMATDVLPAAPDMMGAFVAVAPPPAPPPPPRGVAASARKPSPEVEPVNPDLAPVDAPPTLVPEQVPFVDNRIELGGSSNVGSGVLFGSDDGVDGGLIHAPPLPVLPPRPAARETVRVGGNVLAPRKTRDVRPVYPQIAVQGRVQGYVILEATIDVRGRVSDVRVLQSKPFLDQAAIDAVRQWEFTPTLLNGEPVAIIMNVTVNFQLN